MMNPLIGISPHEALELRNLPKKEILLLSSEAKDPVLHCEAIVSKHLHNGAKIVSTKPYPSELGARYLVRRQGYDNLFEVLYKEEATLRVIGAGQDFGYRATLIFGAETTIPVPESI